MVDFVMDDLDWKIFGLDFVDGIVVSILDSFGFDLFVLDFLIV